MSGPMTALTAFVNEISQASPFPWFIAWLSYQSTSPPSKLFAKMKFPKLVPQVTGSDPAEVGFSLSPKALTIILIPLLL